MNASRHHTDGERHDGDTPNKAMVAIAQPGVVIRSDDIQTAADLAAGIWLIQNRGRPEGEEDPLPTGVTVEHVERAIARHRKEANRRAIEAHKAALSTPLPKPQRTETPADQRIDNDHVYTGRVPVWVFVVLIVVAGLATVGFLNLLDLVTKGRPLW